MRLFYELVCRRQTCTLDDCLSLLSEIESLFGDRKIECEPCEESGRGLKQDGSRGVLIQNLPSNLVVHIARFKGGKRLNTTVDFPVRLDLDNLRPGTTVLAEYVC